MHANKGKSILRYLTARIDYATNPLKTQNGEFISSYECDPRTADAQFALANREYRIITGRAQKHDVIAYQFRQSFRPGEVTPEEANRIGYEFAQRFLKGNHAFIVATHTDRQHVHNHIIWNAVSLDCQRKFRDFHHSGMAARRLSDLICLEHGLSIIENPKHHGQSYNKWQGEKATPSHRELFRRAIDEALAKKPESLDALLQSLQDAGYEIKRGKQIAFRGQNQKRFVRIDTLGEGYALGDLLAIIAGKKERAPHKRQAAKQKKVSLAIDIQRKLQEGKGTGYERWAKVFNVKQFAASLNYLTEHNITDLSELVTRAQESVNRYNALSAEIKAKETRMNELSKMRSLVFNYLHTRETYAAYRKSGYSKAFLAEHDADIRLHKATKKAFDEMGLKKLPSIRSLQNEFGKLAGEKKALYYDYRLARDEMRELLTIKENIERLLQNDSLEKQRLHQQTR